MITDNNLLLAGSLNTTTNVITGQTVTGASAVLSTNTVDLSQNRDIGEGEELSMSVMVNTAFAGLTALNIEIIVADDAALSTNVTVIGASGSIPVAQLTAGARHMVSFNAKIASKGQRYLGARFTPTGTGTAGVLTGVVTSDIQDGQKFYPGGFTVL